MERLYCGDKLTVSGEYHHLQDLADCILFAMQHGYEPSNAVSDLEYSIRYNLGEFDEDCDMRSV